MNLKKSQKHANTNNRNHEKPKKKPSKFIKIREKNKTPKNIVNSGQIQIIASEAIGNVCPKKNWYRIASQKNVAILSPQNLTIVQV